jgi:hypothetical protein
MKEVSEPEIHYAEYGEVEMKERPILFSTEMVKAILAGRKTMTRRVVKPQPPEGLRIACIEEDGTHYKEWLYAENNGDPVDSIIYCPYGQAGDRLWVRERIQNCMGNVAYVSDAHIDGTADWVWQRDSLPSIHMPKGLSRITLEITNIRVERLQEITHKDALAEGVEYDVSKSDGWPLSRFQHPWNSINAKRGYSWESNPWVWVIEFKEL